MKTARIYKESGAYHYCDESWEYVDPRREGYSTKSDAMRSAYAAGYTHVFYGYDKVKIESLITLESSDRLTHSKAKGACPMTSTHAFNAAFAASQLSARIKQSGQIATSEKIAAGAIGMADAEAEGIDWGQVNFDSVCDAVARMIEGHLICSDSDLEDLRRDAAQIVRKEARRVA